MAPQAIAVTKLTSRRYSSLCKREQAIGKRGWSISAIPIEGRVMPTLVTLKSQVGLWWWALRPVTGSPQRNRKQSSAAGLNRGSQACGCEILGGLAPRRRLGPSACVLGPFSARGLYSSRDRNRAPRQLARLPPALVPLRLGSPHRNAYVERPSNSLGVGFAAAVPPRDENASLKARESVQKETPADVRYGSLAGLFGHLSKRPLSANSGHD